MRESCARVLAAALMTGAIAFAVGMPALFETAHDFGRSLLAPPSSLQRTVRAPALGEPSIATGPQHPGDISAASLHGRNVPASGRNAVLSSHPQSRWNAAPGNRAPSKPKPKPAPTPQPAPGTTPAPQVGTRELASASPPAPVRSPQQPPTARVAGRAAQHPQPKKPKGKAKGHDHQNAGAPTPTTETPQPAATTTAASPAASVDSTSGPPEQETADGHDNGQGQGHDKDKASGGGNGNGGGHDKGNGQAKGHEG
jgi:hypothetical protein